MVSREQLPRRSLNCFWRRDGQPVWNNPALCADETRDYGADEKLASRFLRELAQRLGLDAKYFLALFAKSVEWLMW